MLEMMLGYYIFFSTNKKPKIYKLFHVEEASDNCRDR